jgi:hypothetical protein
MIVENDLRGSFVDLKLCAHLLDLRRLLFESCSENFHPFLELADRSFLFF